MNILIGKKLTILGVILITMINTSFGQSISPKLDTLVTNSKSLIIGLDELNKQHIWASGTSGTVLKSSDGGVSWETYTYKKADSLQFRAIKAISETKALVMSAGEGLGSQIFLFDVNKGWIQVFQMDRPEGFLDAIELLPDHTAIAYGDAIDNEYYILHSDKEYKNWKRVNSTLKAGDSEGGFASSGSNIAITKKGEVFIGTGAGGQANVLYSNKKLNKWSKISTPMITGDAAGITSIRSINNNLLIVGGDLAIADAYTKNLFLSTDKGDSWEELPQPVTKGAFYGADISYIGNKLTVIICGPAGADYWAEGMDNWIQLSQENLWTAEFISQHEALLAGRNGNMIKVSFKNQ